MLHDHSPKAASYTPSDDLTARKAFAGRALRRLDAGIHDLPLNV